MEGRRGFLGRLFGGRTPELPPEDPNKTKEQIAAEEDAFLKAQEKKAMSRRRFLGGLAATGAAAGIGAVGMRVKSASAEAANSEREVAERKERLKNFAKLLEEFRERNAPKTERGGVVAYTSRSLQEQDALHDKFIKEMARPTTEMLTEALQYKERDVALDIYRALENMDALGVFYQCLNNVDAKPWTSGPLEKDQTWRRDRPKVRAADYLPTGDQISASDIDPRIGQKKGKTGDAKAEYYGQSSVYSSLRKEDTWVNTKHTTAFRKAVDDPEIRKIMQSSDATLAEVYSAIKAGLMASDFSNNPTEVQQAVQAAFESGERFRSRELIGPNTDQFIYFNHPAKNEERSLPTDAVDMFASYMRELHPDNPNAVREMKNENKIPGYGATPQETAVQSALDILSAIRESRGNATIFFNTHGDSEYVGISEQARDVVLTAEEIASALIDRVQKENNPEALRGTNIVLAACYGHNFGEKIGAQLAKQWKERTNQHPETLAMPTVISAAQTGSVSYHDGMSKTLVDNQHAFKKDGALTGEFLLRRVQPTAYHYEDLTVFSGENAGDWKEVAETSPQSTTEFERAA